jgi:lipopolysaccharide transport system ATP-binding protein
MPGTNSGVIAFDHVSKCFNLQRSGARSFPEAVVRLLDRRRRQEPFWVLDDVSFSVAPGTTLGLIGPNGAGKSTVLKLISRIIEPTAGEVRVDGRVGALLELGAGFHPDLSGRENIYLNGSILGLSRAEIRHKLDAIVDFSELGRFIDVPVKHYSSGMYVRLGFAVAVHIDPEILLVDEVLAVGDASFQHKCLDRVAQLRRDGVTILLVSHDLDTIQLLCDEALWFSQGRIQRQGAVTDVVMAYLNDVARREEGGGAQGVPPSHADKRWGTGKIRIWKVELCNGDGTPSSTFHTGDPMEIHLHYRTRERVAAPVFGLAIHHQNGTHICGPNTGFGRLDLPAVSGEGEVVYRIPALPLLEGAYLISVAAHHQADVEMYDFQDRLYPFRVYPGRTPECYGLVTLNGTWSVADEAPDAA